MRVDEPRYDEPAVGDRFGFGNGLERDPIPHQPEIPNFATRQNRPTHMQSHRTVLPDHTSSSARLYSSMSSVSSGRSMVTGNGTSVLNVLFVLVTIS